MENASETLVTLQFMIEFNVTWAKRRKRTFHVFRQRPQMSEVDQRRARMTATQTMSFGILQEKANAILNIQLWCSLTKYYPVLHVFALKSKHNNTEGKIIRSTTFAYHNSNCHPNTLFCQVPFQSNTILNLHKNLEALARIRMFS